MAFDKEEYWDNRKKGLRGQGHTVKTKFVSKFPDYSSDAYEPKEKPLSRYAVRKNTKRARAAAKRGE